VTHKIYPVQHLLLGPQYSDPAFVQVYRKLPNFHYICNSSEEAFATGTMGDAMNYAHMRAVLGVAQQYSGASNGVMSEVEEDILHLEGERVVMDRGCPEDGFDGSQLADWKHLLVQPTPKFELHHGIDISKSDCPSMPFTLEALMKHTTEAGFSVGGWFVFAKHDVWAFRSNEFSNVEYGAARNSLQSQTKNLIKIVASLTTSHFVTTSSMEKVHAIWHF
jgi:hypothetical protein